MELCLRVDVKWTIVNVWSDVGQMMYIIGKSNLFTTGNFQCNVLIMSEEYVTIRVYKWLFYCWNIKETSLQFQQHIEVVELSHDLKYSTEIYDSS